MSISTVPENLQVEPISCASATEHDILGTDLLLALVVRVLYRLRSLSEQAPFDGPTFSYVSPLISSVVSAGGFSMSEEDDPLEQLALSLDVVKFHCGECQLYYFIPFLHPFK